MKDVTLKFKLGKDETLYDVRFNEKGVTCCAFIGCNRNDVYVSCSDCILEKHKLNGVPNIKYDDFIKMFDRKILEAKYYQKGDIVVNKYGVVSKITSMYYDNKNKKATVTLKEGDRIIDYSMYYIDTLMGKPNERFKYKIGDHILTYEEYKELQNK